MGKLFEYISQYKIDSYSFNTIDLSSSDIQLLNSSIDTKFNMVIRPNKNRYGVIGSFIKFRYGSVFHYVKIKKSEDEWFYVDWEKYHFDENERSYISESISDEFTGCYRCDQVEGFIALIKKNLYDRNLFFDK